MSGPVPASGWRELLFWCLRRRRTYRVTGPSMTPTLPDGAVVLVNPAAYVRQPPQAGDLVVARHPFRTDVTLLKRVAEVQPDGRCVLLSDNPAAGTDSRSFGPIRPTQILGKVTSRLR